jgi:ubiquinone/menaquinone biosynthesis C-methylase UbiE
VRCAYATESLEHAIDIPTAVAELCRIVAPGGRIVIIDKDASAWGRLETPDWERWFEARELEQLLRATAAKFPAGPFLTGKTSSLTACFASGSP